MKQSSSILIILVAFSISGCSRYWYQDGKTFQECQQAREECFEELKKRTDFKGLTVDYEIEYMNQCMAEKGYKAVEKKDLSLDVKRQEPESSLHWRIRGLAGTR